ncbi:hypothetical protein ACHAAC_10740 [Aeromicrobium sp. CF4.19]|uniref:hypothetical protein n=1 Tax=Aeromicrobium sp. CF4.19 TaxID=3373082 RepID=UPI003EE4AA41
MSEEKRPPRRRIAGESGPATGAKAPARRVVKKPVARPGATPPSSTSESSAKKPAKKARGRAARSTPAVTSDVESDESVQPAAPSARPEAEESTQRNAPRIVPASRRGRSRAATTTTAPVSDEGDSKVDTVTDEPSASETGTDLRGTGSTGRRFTRTRILTAVVMVLALVFGAGASYWAWDRAQGTFGVEAAQGEAADAAAVAAEQILSYRYDQLDEHLENSQALMTPSFAEDFESISPALDDLAPQRQIQVEATARDAAAQPCGSDCSTDSVEVLIFIDQARLVDGDEQPTVFGNRITLSMVESDGEWLVDDIEAY